MSENDDEDVFGALDNATEEPGFGGSDFADWWEPDENDDDGKELIGLVAEIHSEPQDWTDPGDVPDPVYTVMSLGRGDHEEGDLMTPKQHKQLKRGLEGADVGDLVKLEFTGYEKVQGNMMMTYEVGVVEREAWEELSGASDVASVLEEHKESGGIYGDNRRTEPYTGGSSGGSSGGDGQDDSEAVSALKEIVDVQNGSIPIDKADKVLNGVRELDVDVEETAVLAGYDVEDGEIRR